jgi:PLP dependent protein
MDVAGNMQSILNDLPSGVSIVVISKTRSPSEIMQLYSAGHRIMGENKVQELIEKKARLPGDIRWHMVGHLQTNKVKYIAPFISFIHSVDSVKLFNVINREAIKNNRIINCLLQVHIATEESKFGFSPEEVNEFLNGLPRGEYPGVCIRGLMGMATYTDDLDLIRSEFRGLAGLFRSIRNSNPDRYEEFNELSMGMSGDYKIAVEEGSTMIRIGSLIFGERT